jgi:ATP-dependent Clp protease protease subunit
MSTKIERPLLEKAKADLERIKAESSNDAPELLVDVSRAEMHLYGRIGPQKAGGVSAAQFAEALKAMGGKDFTLFINSQGGEVTNGWGIGNQIDRYAGKVTGVADGIAGSVASYILCCCDVRLISPASAVMIHNAWSDFAGNAEAMAKEAEILAKFSKGIHAKYVEVSGQSSDQISRWMAEESWFFNDEAITAGFCSGYFGKPANYRPKLAAARRSALRSRMETLNMEHAAILAAYGEDA